MKIVLFNGPPRSGKDTAASIAQGLFYNSQIMKFAMPLKRAVAALYFGGHMEDFKEYDEELKSIPQEVFYGKSAREVQIAISEVLMKPLHNQYIFGNILVRDIMRLPTETEVIFIPDSGFVSEAEVLIDTFGPDNVLLINLYREGTDFNNDSRNYIDLKHLGVQNIHLYNNGNLEGLKTTLETILKGFINGY